jgi:hypothetical protein
VVLVVRRLAGARTRAEERKAGTYRDPAPAAKKQRRRAEQAERHAVRQIIRRELAEALEDAGDELAA